MHRLPYSRPNRGVLSLPILSFSSHVERQRNQGEGAAGERNICFSREDNIPRPVPFLSLLIERTHKHTANIQSQHTRSLHLTVINTSQVPDLHGAVCRRSNLVCPMNQLSWPRGSSMIYFLRCCYPG